MKRAGFLFVMLVCSAVFPICTAGASNTDGAGLDGVIVSEINTPEEKADITKMNLVNTLDLSDNSDIDDGAAISEAMGKMKSGQALYLPNGTYNLDRAVILSSGKSIVGESIEGTVLKVKEGTTGAVVKGDSVTDCLVENMTLTSDWSGKYSLSTVAGNPDIGQLKFGVLLYSCERTSVRNLIIEKFNTAGISLNSGSKYRIENNRISNATDLSGDGHGYGILIQDKSGNDCGVNTSIISGNSLQGPYLRHGVLLQAFSNHNEIKNNLFEQIQLDAVDLHGEGEHHNEIAENKIYCGGESGVGAGNGPLGVHGASGEYNYIHNNDISGCVYGITVMMGTKNTVIEQNTVSDSETAAIRLRHSELTAVCGNSISDTDTAVLFQKDAVDGGKSVYTLFENNIMENVGTACMIEREAAADRMFVSVSGNCGGMGAFIKIMPDSSEYLSVLAGYAETVLVKAGIGNRENSVLEEGDYSEILYFQWNPMTFKPERTKTVLYKENEIL